MPKPFPSRLIYIEVVANLIKDKHPALKKKKDENRTSCFSGNGESFVFGLSGKWGEGKTFFLQQLEGELIEKHGFKVNEVVLFRPWKFAEDKNSLIRSFLEKIDIYDVIDSSEFNKKNYVSFDIEKVVVFFFSLILLTGFVWKLIHIFGDYGALLNFLFTTLFSAVMIPILISIVSINNEVPPSEDLDQVDKIFKRIVTSFEINGTKLVVFVDDLDRCLPSVCRNVLDSLRTFFDSSQILYVVTGDHRALESNLGREFSSGTEVEVCTEGQRYLKKIFNIYWRLPLPLEADLDQFIIADVIDPNKDVLDKIFGTAPFEPFLLEDCFHPFFNKNLREIERFIELLIFNFQVIEVGMRTSDPEVQKFYEDIKNNPKLLIRVMLIQEFCNPLFELFIRDITIFEQIERQASRGEYDAWIDSIQGIPNKNPEKILSNEISENFTNILKMDLNFFNKDQGMRNLSFKAFFYLSATKDFENLKGVDPDVFWKILGEELAYKGKILELINVQCSEIRIQKIIKFIEEKYRKLSEIEDEFRNSDNECMQIQIYLSRLALVLPEITKYKANFTKLIKNWDLDHLLNEKMEKINYWKMLIAWRTYIDSSKKTNKPIHESNDLKLLTEKGEEIFLQEAFTGHVESNVSRDGDFAKIFNRAEWSVYFQKIKNKIWRIYLKNGRNIDQFSKNLHQFTEDFKNEKLAPANIDAENLYYTLIGRVSSEGQLRYFKRNASNLWKNIKALNLEKIPVNVKNIATFRGIEDSFSSGK